MHYSKPMFRRSAFTLIEVIVVVSIIAILATLTSVNYFDAQEAARDGRRKSDVRTYLGAMSSYYLAKGTYFVQLPAGGCVATGTDASVVATGASCVGANGRSYGALNLTGASFSNGVYNVAYPSVSIASALQQGGFISTPATDPKNKSVTVPTNPDYILIRACNTGAQNVTSGGGSNIGIWTSLEKPLSTVDATNSSRYAGGSLAGVNNGDHYDFGVPALVWYKYQNSFGTGYAVGNAVTKTTALLDKGATLCAAPTGQDNS